MSGEEGGLRIDGGSLVVRNSRFVGLQARIGGAVFIRGGKLQLEQCVLEANRAESGGATWTRWPWEKGNEDIEPQKTSQRFG